MISILRSNQPIAWFIVPATLIAGLTVHYLMGVLGLPTALVHGAGALGCAAWGHHMYVNRNFVERGDPALAWLVCVWAIILVRDMPWQAACIEWVGLLLACACLSLTLQMHRQASTSGIQFRAGAIGVLAMAFNPSYWGLFVGLILIQINTRPAVLREWLMLWIGGIWGGLIALALDWAVHAEGWGPVSTATVALKGVGAPMAIAFWAFIGVLIMLRQQSNKTLRIQNTRLNVLLFFASLVAGMHVEYSFSDGIELARSSSFAGESIALAFATVTLVPEFERNQRNRSSGQTWGFVCFVGTVLVLFATLFLK